MNCDGRARRGSSLIETIAVIAVAGTCTVLSSTLIFHAFAAHGQSVRHLVGQTELERLHDRWMVDIHHCRDCKAANDLQLQMDEGVTIHYLLRENELVRQQWRQSILLGEQAFFINRVKRVSFQVETTSGNEKNRARLAVVEIQRDDTLAYQEPFRMLARIGARHFPRLGN